MKAFFVCLLFMMISTMAMSAELTHLKYLHEGDPIWYSNDGEAWQQGEFVYFVSSPKCEATETRQDATNNQQVIYSCDENAGVVETVRYQHSTDYDGFIINYVTGVDPSLPPPTKAELYGLLTRVENLINTNSIPSFFTTAKGLIDDRIDMQRRVELLRENLKTSDIE